MRDKEAREKIKEIEWKVANLRAALYGNGPTLSGDCVIGWQHHHFKEFKALVDYLGVEFANLPESTIARKKKKN